MPEQVIVLGAGGHGKVVADTVLSAGDLVLGFLDDSPEKVSVWDLPVLGSLDKWVEYACKARFVFGLGDNAMRQRLANQMQVSWYTAVHPTACLGHGVTLGEGTVVLAEAVLNADSVVGSHCIINTGAVIEHDCRVGSYTHISPRAVLCGTVVVGEMSHIGACAVVRNNLRICSRTVVGAGGVVIQDITEPGTYVGIPTRRLENRDYRKKGTLI